MTIPELTDEMKSVVALVGGWTALFSASLFILDMKLNGYTEEKRLKAKDMIEKILFGGEEILSGGEQ